MRRVFDRNISEKNRIFLGLDIGTEAVKALIFSIRDSDGKKDKRKIIILGTSSQYFERYGVFDGKDFEAEVIKNTILKAINEAEKNFIFFSKKEERLEFLNRHRKENWKKWPTLVSLPANILKGRITSVVFKRRKLISSKISEVEEKNIYTEIFERAQEEIGQEFAQEFGILADDIYWIVLKILETKIDGYLVSRLQGYEGKDLEFKILATFLPKYYFENIKKILKDSKLEVLKIVHTAESLLIISQDEKKDGIFLDIGGEVSQIFLLRDGKLQRVNEFEKGGKGFSQRLADNLGIDEESARLLKERYSNKQLSAKTTKRIKEMLLEEKRVWYENLKLKIKKISPKQLLPSNIFLFGGGSLVPEIQEACLGYDTSLAPSEGLKSVLEDLLISASVQLRFIYPKDLKNIEDATKSLTSPKDIPPLLICYNIISKKQ